MDVEIVRKLDYVDVSKIQKIIIIFDLLLSEIQRMNDTYRFIGVYSILKEHIII